jgi:hypothetical protein
MSQISPPIRILLAGSLVFMMAWFVLLRPSAEPTATPQPAPASGYGKAVDNANGAAAATEAAQANSAAAGAAVSGSAAPATASGSAPATADAPAGAPAATAAKPSADAAELGLPAAVAKAVAQKKVLVMLFWNKNAIDDRAVRRELRGIDRHHGKVKVHVASIKDVARYAPITRGVNLEQSPTIVVAKGATADALVGYVDAGTIDQTVSDILRSR